MKPGGTLEYRRPVHGAGLELTDRRMCAIVNDVRRPLARASFGKIDPDPVAAAKDEVCSDSFCPKCTDSGFADVVLWKAAHVVTVQPELREACRHVRFATPEGCRQRRRLKKAFVSWRAEP